MSIEAHPDFVHTGPGSLAGRYLRKFWQPVHVSARLGGRCAVPLRIMGEDFTLYRGESGKAHLVGPTCPHRRTKLSTGWVEEDTIRCGYHGWRFDGSGRCVEQPAESRPFCDRVPIPSYPTEEHLGFIFAYLGEGAPPPLPRFPELEHGTQRASAEMLPCNYFQSAENIMDDVHVAFAHSSVYINKTMRKTIPKVTAEETDFGLTQFLEHPGRMDKIQFLMPNSCFLSYPRSLGINDVRGPHQPESVMMRALFWYVPIDDESHLHFLHLSDDPPVQRRREPEATPVHEEIAAILEGRKTFRDVMSHPELVRIQDGVSIVGQGKIVDRSKEHLGRTDAAISLLRRIWVRELRLLSEGKPIKFYGRPLPEDLLDLYDSKQ